MKFGVVIFPGSNCDRDMVNALHEDLHQQVETLWHKDDELIGFTKDDVIILPGGFSYGDYLRCGAIARFSPMMKRVIEFANDGGKVLGVCNGFQILCESGLLPGVLLRNENSRFVCKNVFIKNAQKQADAQNILSIPVAHGEGRYYINDAGLEELKKNDQILYEYCNERGDTNADYSPNGSLANIAGITNKQGNVIGMMPHPERACAPMLQNTDGQKIFRELFSMN